MNDAPQLPGEHPTIPCTLTKKIAARLHALADLATDLSAAGITAEAKIAGGLLEILCELVRSDSVHDAPEHRIAVQCLDRIAP